MLTFLRGFIVSDLTFRSLIHCKLIFVIGIRQVSSFCISISYLPILFIKTIFSPLSILGTLVKCWLTPLARIYSHDIIYIHDTQFCMFLFVPVPHCFESYSFCQQLTSGSMMSPAFFLFLRKAWAIWVLCVDSSHTVVFLFL